MQWPICAVAWGFQLSDLVPPVIVQAATVITEGQFGQGKAFRGLRSFGIAMIWRNITHAPARQFLHHMARGLTFRFSGSELLSYLRRRANVYQWGIWQKWDLFISGLHYFVYSVYWAVLTLVIIIIIIISCNHSSRMVGTLNLFTHPQRHKWRFIYLLAWYSKNIPLIRLGL